MNTGRNPLLAALLGLLLFLTGCTGVPTGIVPVHGFDARRYLGTWHEIARLDHGFERGLTPVTATYAARDDGGISVLNRGYDPAQAKWREATGRAYFLVDRHTASLKVSFFGPFYGGYHVFALDPEYRWAMIAGPSRDYFWILARDPVLSPDLLADLLQRARLAGFATDQLIFPGAARATP